MRIGRRYFAPRSIGRQLVLLFVGAAMVPLVFLAVYSLSRISSELLSVREDELIQTSKSYGMGVIQRLQQTRHLLTDVADISSSPEQVRAVLDRHIGRELSYFEITGSDNTSDDPVIQGSGRQPQGDEVVTLLGAEAGSLQVRVPVRIGDANAVIAGTLRPAFLWGSAEELPTATEILVIDESGHALYQSRRREPMATGVLHQRLQQNVHSGTEEIETDTGDLRYIGYWTLSLAGVGGNRLMIATSQPASYVNAAIRSFHHAFIPVALLSAITVALLALTQIRRLLAPLDALQSAAEKVSANDFASPAPVEGANEFAALGKAFNAMADQIGQQLTTLERYAEIDRIVLTTLDIPAVIQRALSEVLLISGASSAAIVIHCDDAPGIRRYAMAQDRLDRMQSVVERDVSLRGRNIDIDGVDGAAKPEVLACLGGISTPYVWCKAIEQRSALLGALILGSERRYEPDEQASSRIAGFLDRIAIAVTALRREQLLVKQANFDSLTGLPNRFSFLEKLDAAVTDAIARDRCGALLFLDLDQFKRANDVLGHLAGDALLRMAASRLRDAIRPGDFLARLGGDEFTILCNSDDTDQDIASLAARLIECLSEPFEAEGRSVFVGLSIGSVRFPADGVSGLDLLRRADTAMYHAKKSGGQSHAPFRASMEDELHANMALESDLRDAFAAGHFLLFYQAKHSLAAGTIVGAEALIRWGLPDGTILGAHTWMPRAESMSLINDIGGWVLTRACLQMRAWDDAGRSVERIAVNVAARQLEDDRFYEIVLAALEAGGIAPHRLELEITESQLMANPGRAIPLLRRLTEIGITLAVDDFGTGYSSFSQLRQLPLSVLKIDKSLVSDAHTSADARAVVLAIIQMAHTLQFQVVAEGVETEEQLSVLAELGCDVAQGYFIGHPLPADQFEARHLGALDVQA